MDSLAPRRHAPATARNRDAIGEVLAAVLPAEGLVLEIASGTGEHVAAFAPAFPALRWQPSDPDTDARASIAAWCDELSNVAEPIALDAAAADWPVGQADAVLCVNMVHISPWEATLGLMAGAGRLLAPGAPLLLYGPYRRDGVPTAPSNLAFDADLRARNAEWGLRRLEDVVAVAEAQGLVLERVAEMPANNLMPVFRRR
ncbi:DUF938 domain-containing protein [Sphingomonas hengshuiensis]|uniref:SAM-dependent methyltransferase n=1 Tax=Sphingomonas hengshuiensis TaxID=1609977 RepID=A0A7U5BER4_9SPHN|nr:DUF938 domain-containing protein [Sphingomonas hengshuiensis]AJP70942.1 SAM-dependent methyltransferase [Sphingomonas hengshuiensis]